MLILALDTSMAACSACVYDPGAAKILAANHAFMEKGQAEALAPLVQQTMQQASIAFSAITHVAVTIGPGTFTGVRIGLAFARGLGVSLAIPVIGMNSLAAIACNEKSPTLPIIVASDARGDHIYFATFDAQHNQLTPPAIIRRQELEQALPSVPCIVLGTASGLVCESGRHSHSPAGDLPLAVNFAQLASSMPADQYPPDPLYLRPPDVKLPVIYSEVGVTGAGLLAQMHAECFDQQWNEKSFTELLSLTTTSAVVASNQQTPVAFVLFRTAADEAEILTICTRPPLRQQGLAKALLQHVELKLRPMGTKSLFIEVATSNSAALALYAAAGFQKSGLRKEYYTRSNGQRDDALVMRKDLTA